MHGIIETLVALLVLTGATFALIGSFGLAKLSDFYRRLHGPTKAATLGVGCVLIGSCLTFTVATGALSLREFLITVFLFLSAPVSAHLLIKAALRLDPHPPAMPVRPEDDRGTS